MQLSKELREILSFSKEEALRTGCDMVTNDHVVLGAIRQHSKVLVDFFAELKVSIPFMKRAISERIDKGFPLPYSEVDNIDFAKTVRTAFLESLPDNEKKEPDVRNLLLAIIRINDSVFSEIMIKMGFSYDNISSMDLFKYFGEKRLSIEPPAEDRKEEPEDEKPENEEPAKRKSKASPLETYGYDLTKAAAEDKLDPVVGRENEIARLAQILGRRKKNNPIIIGEPGVGKSAIAEGLAIRIAHHNVSRVLLNKRIISLDIGSIVAGTKFRGQFEERIKSILQEIKGDPNVILFIDELHTLVGAGGAIGSLDAANMLKPALARGELQCIGATTLDEFRKVIEKDGALERRFQKVLIEPTTFDETLFILDNIKSRYEQHHHVIYSPEAIRACITLSTRYISDRCLPDKAIDVLDEAGSKAHLKTMIIPDTVSDLDKEVKKQRDIKRKAIDGKDFEKAEHFMFLEKETQSLLDRTIKEFDEANSSSTVTVTEEDIYSVMSMMTGIPLNKIAMSESNKLLQMADTIRERVIGQDDAVDKVVRAIQRNRAGLKDPNKPIGTFLFLGPTGVGKTHLAKVLAEYLFDSPESLIRIDMSEYMEKFAVSRLIGAPPGYVGYEDGGQLSERVRRKPYSVVLLDEIEKAHQDIFNLLLQVLDEGRLTDSNGRYIDFRNTVLIMTSNIGSREIKDFGKGIGFATPSRSDSSNANKTLIDKAINKKFNPEFINRLDEQIYFNSLSRTDIEKIIDIELKDLLMRIEESGHKLSIDRDVIKFVADVGYDPRFGARPLKRAIQRYVEDPVAEAIISGSPAGGTIHLKLNSRGDDTFAK